MNAGVSLLLLLSVIPSAAALAQDSTRRARDSAAVADSLALMRELTAATAAPAAMAPRQPGAANPRLLPDLSAVGDLIGDLSRTGSTQEGGQRFSIREVEVAIQAAVDPYFRGDIYLGFSDEEGVAIEQAYLTTTSLPWGLEARMGRFLMPLGKQNTTHRHDLHTIEYPFVLQRFLGPEGLKGTGIYLSKVLAPFGFYQELQVTATDQFGEADESLITEEPINTRLANLGYSARLRNYFDLTRHANIEVSGSVATGKRAQPVTGLGDVTAVPVRQTVFGVDVTYRWRPLQQGLYRSLIVQGEWLRQVNGRYDPPPAASYGGPSRDLSGGYLFARYQVSRRGYLGARFDRLADPETGGGRLAAASAYYQFFPSEFSKLLFGYERASAVGESAYGRILVQATFALGPHRPHPF
ncbi:MAG: hypothetical protein ACKVZ0_07080 [Gemmatimonadales bacterium]